MAFSRLTFDEKACGVPGCRKFGRYRYSASRAPLPAHSHPGELEICFLERGEQTYRVAGRSYRLRGHDQFFTLPHEVHDTANLPEERGILYWLILDVRKTRHFLGLAPGPAATLRRQLLAMPTRHFRAHSETAHLLSRLAGLLAEKTPRREAGPARQLRIQSLLLDYLLQTITASQQRGRGIASPLIGRVLQYIDRHPDEPIHVPRLAQVARLSESRLKARFKAEIGVPPAEYWLRHKIETAVERLKSHSVTEVAHALGFSSSQYFATAFRRYMRANPSQFRGGRTRSTESTR